MKRGGRERGEATKEEKGDGGSGILSKYETLGPTLVF